MTKASMANDAMNMLVEKRSVTCMRRTFERPPQIAAEWL